MIIHCKSSSFVFCFCREPFKLTKWPFKLTKWLVLIIF